MNDMLSLRAKKVAANIRKIREYRNYSQEYLAAKLKISQNAYSKIELGYTKITVDRLFHITDILEVNAIDILNREHAELLQLANGYAAQSVL